MTTNKRRRDKKWEERGESERLSLLVWKKPVYEKGHAGKGEDEGDGGEKKVKRTRVFEAKENRDSLHGWAGERGALSSLRSEANVCKCSAHTHTHTLPIVIYHCVHASSRGTAACGCLLPRVVHHTWDGSLTKKPCRWPKQKGPHTHRHTCSTLHTSHTSVLGNFQGGKRQSIQNICTLPHRFPPVEQTQFGYGLLVRMYHAFLYWADLF